MLFRRNKKINWVPFPRYERSEALSNPYCGLYSIYRFYADEDKNLEDGISLDTTSLDSNQQICLVEINLISFNDKHISPEALYYIKRIFQFFIINSKQMILRFVYDWEGKGIFSEPKDIELIIRHMEQLSSLLKDYEQSIYILQGLFIGSWGEMHNSRYLSERNILYLAKNLYTCSGDSTQIAVRCPSYWRMITKTQEPLNDEDAYSKHMKARFSLFNDGMLASDTDFGTYGSIYANESKKYSDKWIRQDELEFQNRLCKYVSNGGEVINNSEYNDVATAIEDLKKMRVSYLHSEYDLQVLDKWKTQKCGLANSIWRDKSAFDYIAAHLGYRYTISDVRFSVDSEDENSFRIDIKICNKGFAPSYHKFDVKLAIRDSSYAELYEYNVTADTRFWMPGDTIDLKAHISMDKCKKNKYTLGLGIYDARSKRVIELANTFSSVDHEGYYNIGSITLNRIIKGKE